MVMVIGAVLWRDGSPLSKKKKKTKKKKKKGVDQIEAIGALSIMTDTRFVLATFISYSCFPGRKIECA
jgi:hypothetical protein